MLAITSSAPSAPLKKLGGKAKYPPTNAAGIEATAKGQSFSQERKPARRNRHITTEDTSTFSTKAVGLIPVAAMPNKAMTAMKPDAPA